MTKQLLEANLRLDGRSAMKERNISIEFLSKPGIISILIVIRTFALPHWRDYYISKILFVVNSSKVITTIRGFRSVQDRLSHLSGYI